MEISVEPSDWASDSSETRMEQRTRFAQSRSSGGHFEITAEQFARLKRYLPRQRGNVEVPNIAVINAILWAAHNGDLKWSALPVRFGNWHSVYMRMHRWSKSGVLDQLFAQMQRLGMIRLRLDVIPQPLQIAEDDEQRPVGGSAKMLKFSWVPRIRVRRDERASTRQKPGSSQTRQLLEELT